MVSVVKLLDNPVVINLAGGFDFLGEYSGSTSYTTGDSVSYLGSSYVAIQDTTGNLPTNATYWQLIAEKGEQGAQGPQGLQGDSWQEYFETVSKNLKSWGASFNYSGGNLSSIVYTDGVDTITKTFNYTGDSLTSIVLGGDTPSGIDLTKTLGYTSGNLTSVTYS